MYVRSIYVSPYMHVCRSDIINKFGVELEIGRIEMNNK